MTSILAVARTLWAHEPVLVAGATTILVTIGAITTTQADNATKAIASLAAFIVEAGAALGARSQVTPVAKQTDPPTTAGIA